MVPLLLVAVVLVVVSLAGIVWLLSRRNGDSQIPQVFKPTTSVIGIYLILIIAAYLSMTGLRRFAAVRLFSYILNVPWYTLSPLTKIQGDVISITVLVWDLIIIPLTTLGYLYIVAVILDRAAHHMRSQ